MEPLTGGTSKMTYRKKACLIISSFLLCALICLIFIFTIFTTISLITYATISSQRTATPHALNFLKSDQYVKVSIVKNTQDWYEFNPTNNTKKIGFIYYPGGFVDHKAYSPVTYHVTKLMGYKSVLVSFPFGSGVIGPTYAFAVAKKFPKIERWIVGGHSQGGAAVGIFMQTVLRDLKEGSMEEVALAKKIQGVIFYDSYTIADLKDWGGCGAVFYAESRTDNGYYYSEEHKKMLPSCKWVKPIKGGNHAYFGSYGDLEAVRLTATINNTEQLALVYNETTHFMRYMEKRG